MRHQSPAVAHQRAQEVELDRGQVNLLASDGDTVGSLIQFEPVRAKHRLGRRPGARAAQRGAQAGDQLVGAERLGHVVVGTRVERPHLLLLLSQRGQHEDRHLRPLADRAADVDAVPVRQDQVEDGGVGRLERRRVQGVPRALRGDHLEAGVTQDHPQRPQDLRLVVADEDAGHFAARACASAGCSAGTGRVSTIVVP